jgi:hypothetical protein
VSENVVSLPGTEFRPTHDSDIDPKHCLRKLIDKPILDVAAVARLTGGEIVVFGSPASCDAAIGLLTRGVAFLAEGRQVPLSEDAPPDSVS